MARAHIQSGFEQADFIGTGTISDADIGDDKNIQFFIETGQLLFTAIVLGAYREASSKGIPWAQARCQMQITMLKLREGDSFFR